MISSWNEHNWGADELLTLEKFLEKSFEETKDLSDEMEQRMDTLFGAFDDKAPSAKFRNQVLGKLDRAGGSLLDSTQYTENEEPSEAAWNAAKEFASTPGCAW